MPSDPAPDPRPLESRPRVQFWSGMNRLYCTTYHRVDVGAPCRLPRTGPAILVCNHMSGLDPLLLQAKSPRIIVWMMAKEFYELPSIHWFVKMIDAIPVARNGRDSSATRAALRALDRGCVLGVFPEGKIEKDRNLMPFQSGVSLLAIKTGVPVFPAYMDGTQRGKDMMTAFKQAGHVKMRFGHEIDVPRDDTSIQTLDRATAVIQQSVQALKDATERMK